jgi:hypothetical protein
MDLGGNLGVGGRIIFKWILGEIGLERVDWINLAQDRDRWRVVVNMVVNLWVL